MFLKYNKINSRYLLAITQVFFFFNEKKYLCIDLKEIGTHSNHRHSVAVRYFYEGTFINFPRPL